MDIRGERTWCADCGAPRVPVDQVPMINLFLSSIPSYRIGSEMAPRIMEGFNRAEVAALISMSDLPCDDHEAMTAVLEMESQYRAIRAQKAKAKGSTNG